MTAEALSHAHPARSSVPAAQDHANTGGGIASIRAVRTGFTLIELLVVIAILAILAGLTFALLGVAQRSARTTNSKVTLTKVDAALRQFKADAGFYPYRGWNPGDPASRMGNDLGRRLATRLDLATRNDITADADTAAAKYTVVDTSKPLPMAPTGAFAYYTYDGSAIQPFTPERANQRSSPSNEHRVAVNRLAAERARLVVLAGVPDARAPRWDGASGTWKPDGPALVASPAAADPRAGWCDDYLSDGLTTQDRQPGDHATLVDRFGHPLIYVCPVVPGVRGYIAKAGEMRVDEMFYGLAPRGRDVTSSLASDLRTTAPARWLLEPETWSGGPDGRFEPGDRGAAVNRDNLAVNDHLAGLH
jgi:prepilin-type N-terminal cleavage/methylation domain-containing protein